MPEAIWIKLIGTLPSIFWAIFAIIVYLSLRETIIHRLVPRVTALRALGVEVEMAGQLLEQAAEHSDSPVTPTMRRGVLSRLEHAADTLKGGRLLWIDDHPEHNGSLISLFRSMGMVVDTARSTAEGLTALRHGSHDIILSDMDRDGDPRAGITMLRELEDAGVDLPVVVHAQNFNPELGVDSRIFAGTNNPVEVVHYVIDLMERIRFAAPEV
ncbi:MULTISPECIES: response regulator [Streptomyces]|uniref:response regulator n=1 Tax=Streptomyces TaxID=1883 RepID=UPI001E524276|nr:MULTISPECIES: response regulator [Streptomyces]UFQ16542.1 response regulator [Streptomyces huasconensis]WCL86144.1 response regulator [Streptomyces sp. JCM 35825]